MAKKDTVMPNLEDLPKKYPALFENHPYSKGSDKHYYSFQCGDGWYHILEALLLNINWLLGRYREVEEIKKKVVEKGKEPLPWIADYFEKNKEDPLASFSIVQIKEKFGGLRFYYECEASIESENRIRGAVDVAESMSFRTCEVCGNPGKCSSAGCNWLSTLCPEHTGEIEKAVQKEEQDD
jgi:hypothetical protein